MQDDNIINEKDLKNGKILVLAALAMIFIIMFFITFLIFTEQQKAKNKKLKEKGNIENTIKPSKDMF